MSKSQTVEIPFVKNDTWLLPFADAIRSRLELTAARKASILGDGTLESFAQAHTYFGLHRVSDGWVFRERAPNASRIYLVGDFNAWQDTYDFRLKQLENGVWERHFPPESFSHGQHYKLRIFWIENGSEHSGERIPSHCQRVVQDHVTKIFSAQVWNPEHAYTWKNPSFQVPHEAPRIYEAHLGMAQEDARVGTYREFMDNILPRIVRAGYNTIQLMAIQEHPYYGSFGYQVSNFFAPSSRFGTPEELMELMDAAHGCGIAVIMDIVHSHAVKNELEGLSRFDGTTTLYFHAGERGEHPAWKTRLFDYAKPETLHLLLSNCRYWLEKFRFDGFRFDGVTSMLYHDHGLGRGFDSYERYFDENLDLDAVAYLTLANELIHALRPDALTIAEDVSGMPGLAAPIAVGGVGFDFRLAMGVPDYWIKIIKEHADEAWNVSTIWFELTNRRREERTIGYCESHDQAMVGDKTIIFRLADQDMYWFMRRSDKNLVVERAIALHKMIRLITMATAGSGYLNFMGNEFGHPEWIDFPREGNGWLYHYARRLWSVRDNPDLRFGQLAEFDQQMMELAARHKVLDDPEISLVYEHISDQVLAFKRAGLLFLFNFNPTRSFSDLAIPAESGRYSVVLDSDAAVTGGLARVDATVEYRSKGMLLVYLPNRTALVFRRDS